MPHAVDHRCNSAEIRQVHANRNDHKSESKLLTTPAIRHRASNPHSCRPASPKLRTFKVPLINQHIACARPRPLKNPRLLLFPFTPLVPPPSSPPQDSRHELQPLSPSPLCSVTIPRNRNPKNAAL